jgi:hypothetical protein
MRTAWHSQLQLYDRIRIRDADSQSRTDRFGNSSSSLDQRLQYRAVVHESPYVRTGILGVNLEASASGRDHYTQEPAAAGPRRRGSSTGNEIVYTCTHREDMCTRRPEAPSRASFQDRGDATLRTQTGGTAHSTGLHKQRFGAVRYARGKPAACRTLARVGAQPGCATAGPMWSARAQTAAEGSNAGRTYCNMIASQQSLSNTAYCSRHVQARKATTVLVKRPLRDCRNYAAVQCQLVTARRARRLATFTLVPRGSEATRTKEARCRSRCRRMEVQ